MHPRPSKSNKRRIPAQASLTKISVYFSRKGHMKLLEHVNCAFDDALSGKLESALLHACIGIDATAKSLYPNEVGVGKRFIRCIRDYYWLVEPMMGVGLNLVDTRFSNVSFLTKNKNPDFADLVYHIHRCSHAHGEEVSLDFSLTTSEGLFVSDWEFGPNSVRMPDKVIWALLAISVFSRVNYRLLGGGEKWQLFWGCEIYPLAKWWGREDELKPIALGWNTQRVELREMARLNSADPVTGKKLSVTLIAPSPPTDPMT